MPLLSTLSFHSLSLLISYSSVSAITAKSSAYSNSHGKATLNSLDTASVTIMNNSRLNAEPWCPTVVHNISQNSSNSFPLIFQTNIIAQILSTGEEGSRSNSFVPDVPPEIRVTAMKRTQTLSLTSGPTPFFLHPPLDS